MSAARPPPGRSTTRRVRRSRRGLYRAQCASIS
jgi:hypothetical protein